MVYNELKLSEYRHLFGGKKVLVIGCGAVGSYEAELFTKMGMSVVMIDPDKLTAENAAKGSCLIHIPDDVGKNKALSAAENVKPLLDKGCVAHGIDGDLCRLGPEAFSSFDYVVESVDNFDAKVLLNILIRQLPPERRPIVIMNGTCAELAQSTILDNTDFCLQCTIDPSTMEHSDVKTSCSGPLYRKRGEETTIVRTSNTASLMAAMEAAEQIRASVIGYDGVMNKMVTYTAYPNFNINISHPIKDPDCPGCRIIPPAEIKWLQGNCLDVTLEQTLTQISEILGSRDFELYVHSLNHRKSIYKGFILTDICRSCGAQIKVMRHESLTYEDELFCDSCKAEGRAANPAIRGAGEEVYAFDFSSAPELLSMSMYDLGFPLGAHLQAAEHGVDMLDKGKITTFAFRDDHLKIMEVNKL